MKLVELMGEDAKSARVALDIINQADEHSVESIEDMMDAFEDNDHIELIKGLCFIVCTVSSFLCGGSSPAPVFKAIRKSTNLAEEEGNEVTVNYKILDLLDATEGKGGSFYILAYSLKEPFEQINGLITLFQTLVQTTMNKDVEEVTHFLNQYIDEKFSS